MIKYLSIEEKICLKAEIEQAKSNPMPKQPAPVSNYTVNDEEEIEKIFND